MINQEEVQVQQDVDELVAEKLKYINYGLDMVVDEEIGYLISPLQRRSVEVSDEGWEMLMV